MATAVESPAPVEVKGITFTKVQLEWLRHANPSHYGYVVMAREVVMARPRPPRKTPYDRKPIDYLAKQEAKYIARLEQIRSAKEAK